MKRDSESYNVYYVMSYKVIERTISLIYISSTVYIVKFLKFKGDFFYSNPLLILRVPCLTSEDLFDRRS